MAVNETPGPLNVGVCLHSLDHWTAEDWQAMSQRIRESEERLQAQIRRDRERLGLRVGNVQNERAREVAGASVVSEHPRNSSPRPVARLGLDCSSVGTSSDG